jgi:hypothetical protein
LAILNAALKPKSTIPFPKLATDAQWDTYVLGELDDRDPLETCGDGAMQVVITELLIEELREKQDPDAIYKVSRFSMAYTYFLTSTRLYIPGW